MFCSKCGTELPDNSLFCTNCGNKLEGNDNFSSNKTAKNELNNFVSFIINCVKNPTGIFSDFTNDMNKPKTCIYSAIFVILISIISSISLRGFASDIIMFLSSFSTGVLPLDEKFKITSQVKEFVMDCLPFSRLFYWQSINIIVFYTLISLSMFIVFTLIMKKSIPFIEYLKVSCVALAIHFVFFILQSVSLFISVTLAIIVYSISNLIILLVLYNGFKVIIKEDNSVIYTYSIFYVISMFLSYYIMNKSIFDYYLTHLQSLANFFN